MKVYTLQHVQVLDTLLKTGQYWTDAKFICEETFKEAYEWLNQMGFKHKPTWRGDRPVWCWVKRPDMRTLRFIQDPQQPPQQPHVLLTLEIPESELLVSHFDLWHCVLNHSPVAVNKEEENIWDKKLQPYGGYCSDNLPESLIKEMKQSWEKILKLHPESFNKFDKTYVGETETLQAITPCLKKEYLVEVEKFTLINKFKEKK